MKDRRDVENVTVCNQGAAESVEKEGSGSRRIANCARFFS